MLKVAIRCLLFVSVLLGGITAAHAQQRFVEYFRQNLFLGIAYHRVGCLTDGNTIVSNQDYDGFTTRRYCVRGERSARGARFFDSNRTTEARLDSCGAQTNSRYGTPNYAARSNTCNYNLLRDCNSDCWIRAFSRCQGKQVSIASPCR